MTKTNSKILLAGLFIVVFASGLTAQTTSEKQDSPLKRLRNLVREIPKEIQPLMPDKRLEEVRPGLFAEDRPIFETASADGQMAAGTADGALYIRPINGEEKRIIAKPDGDWRWDAEGALWSPDGKMIAARMVNDSDVPRIPIVTWLGKHETVFMNPYSRAGEKIARHQLYLVDVASGRATAVQHGADDPYFHILDWNPNGKTLYFLRSDRLTHRLDLLAANALDGKVKLIFTETNKFGALWWNMLQGAFQVSQANQVQMLGNGNFIWTSERSGFAQLYLYDENGRLIRPLTEGKNAGFVQNLVSVDEKRGYAYVIMQGARADALYDQTIYRFRLSDGQPQKLADGPNIRVNFSKDKENLWVLRRGLPDVWQVEEMSGDGSNRKIIWSPDVSFLKESGFSPEIIKTTAADGKTELRSLMIKPKDFDPKKSYPVIEEIYAGPFTNVVVNSASNTNYLQMQEEIANRGFIIVMTDGRGTPDRGQSFQNYAAGRFGQVEIADHAAVLRELGKTRKFMDLSRVGITGGSWGGYFALRALIQEPGLYKAGVLLSPSVDVSSMRVAVEPYMNCLPADCPAAYAAGDNTKMIDKINAPLLIFIGTGDNDVPNAESFKLADALQKAGKDHELVILQGLFHNVKASPLTIPKMADFFEKHLAKPPR